jgi:hypothetical protein
MKKRGWIAAIGCCFKAKGMPETLLVPLFFLAKVNTRHWPILSVPRPKKNNGGDALFGGEATNFVDPDPAICLWPLETIISSYFNKIDQITTVMPSQT